MKFTLQSLSVASPPSNDPEQNTVVQKLHVFAGSKTSSGDFILLNLKDKSFLVDCGSVADHAKFLPHLALRKDIEVVVTHIDQDHVHGLLFIVGSQKKYKITVSKIWMNHPPNMAKHDKSEENIKKYTSRSGKQAADMVHMAPGKSHECFSGMQLYLDENITVISINPSQAIKTELVQKWDSKKKRNGLTFDNIASICLFIDIKDSGGILLTADAHEDDILKGIQGILTQHPEKIFDAVQVPHHGSSNNSTEKFFQTVRSKNYFITQSSAITGLDTVLQNLKKAFKIWATPETQCTVTFVFVAEVFKQYEPGFSGKFSDEPRIKLVCGDFILPLSCQRKL